MPTGIHIRRLNNTDFKPEVSERYIDSNGGMDYIMENKKNNKVTHKLNN